MADENWFGGAVRDSLNKSKAGRGDEFAKDNPKFMQKGKSDDFIGKVFSFETDPFGSVSDAYHGITGTPTAEQKRDTANMMNEQIKAYKDQTELSRQALADAKTQRENEKRRVEEKQIRSIRNRGGRSASLMNTQSAADTKLGGGTNLPNKLGTA